MAGGLLLFVLVRGANRYPTDSTTAETGWPFLVAIAVGLVVLIVWYRQLAARSPDRVPFIGRNPEPPDWNSRNSDTVRIVEFSSGTPFPGWDPPDPPH